MAQPSPFILSQRFSQLVGRKTTFTQVTAAPVTKLKQIYGIYNVVAADGAVVVQADFRLIGSFGGALIGLPDGAVKERLATVPIEECLRDAMYEVLNIASPAVSTEARVVFDKFVMDQVYVDGAAGDVLKKPHHRSFFNVAVDGYEGGRFSILAPFIPGRTVTA